MVGGRFSPHTKSEPLMFNYRITALLIKDKIYLFLEWPNKEPLQGYVCYRIQSQTTSVAVALVRIFNQPQHGKKGKTEVIKDLQTDSWGAFYIPIVLFCM